MLIRQMLPWANASPDICSTLKWCTWTFAPPFPPNPPLIGRHTYKHTCTRTHEHMHRHQTTQENTFVLHSSRVAACINSWGSPFHSGIVLSAQFLISFFIHDFFFSAYLLVSAVRHFTSVMFIKVCNGQKKVICTCVCVRVRACVCARMCVCVCVCVEHKSC